MNSQAIQFDEASHLVRLFSLVRHHMACTVDNTAGYCIHSILLLKRRKTAQPLRQSFHFTKSLYPQNFKSNEVLNFVGVR